MLSGICPDFEVVKDGRILYYVMVGGSYHHSYNNLINNRIQVGETYRVIPLMNIS